jgi:hypothetical protein
VAKVRPTISANLRDTYLDLKSKPAGLRHCVQPRVHLLLEAGATCSTVCGVPHFRYWRGWQEECGESTEKRRLSEVETKDRD